MQCAGAHILDDPDRLPMKAGVALHFNLGVCNQELTASVLESRPLLLKVTCWDAGTHRMHPGQCGISLSASALRPCFTLCSSMSLCNPEGKWPASKLMALACCCIHISASGQGFLCRWHAFHCSAV